MGRRARVGLALGLLLVQAPFLLLLGSRQGDPFFDDAFYYVGTAYRLWQHGFPTFDGLVPTNGFHPLWLATLVVVAAPFAIAGTQTGLVTAVTLLDAALVQVAAQLWLAAAVRSGLRPRRAALATLVAFGAAARLLLGGLESALLAVLLGRVALLLIDERARTQGTWKGTWKWPWRFGLTTGLLVLCRLDLVLGLPLAFGYAFVRRGWRPITRSVLVFVLVVAPYLTWNLVTTGHFEPVSGRAKAAWGELQARFERGGPPTLGDPQWLRSQAGVLGKALLADALPVARLVTGDTVHGLLDRGGATSLLIASSAVLALAMGLAGLHLRRRGVQPRGPRGRIGGDLLILLGAFYVGDLALYAGRGAELWDWYAVPGLLALAMAVAVAVTQALPTRRWTHGRVAHGWASGALVLALVVGGSGREAKRLLTSVGSDFHLGSMAAAEILRTRDAGRRDGNVAGWAVGRLGFYARRPVMNLEGLAGDDRVLSASLTMDTAALLRAFDVRTLVNHFPLYYGELPVALTAGLCLDDRFADLPKWSLRYRALLDSPEAFRPLVALRGGPGALTVTHLLDVDHTALAAFEARRRTWRAQVRRASTVLPAEDATRAASQSVHVPRTEGLAVGGALVVVRAPAAGHTRFARIANTTRTAVRVALVSEALLPPCAWSIVRLAKTLAPVTLPSGVWLDELYDVPNAAAHAAFSTLAADYAR